MNPEKAEPLARWADALQATLEEIRAQQRRPLPSPGLRCLGALVQIVRVARVVREGALVVAATRAQAQHLLRSRSYWDAMRQCGPVALRTGATLGRAGGLLLRTSIRAGRDGWSAWAASRALSRPSVVQLLMRTGTLTRAARMALKEVSYDRR